MNDCWHFHPELELIHFKEGQGTQFIGDHVSSFQPGDLVLLGTSLPHSIQFDGSYFLATGAQKTDVRVVHFSGDLWGESFMDLPENGPVKSLIDKARRGLRVEGAAREKVTVLLERMLDAGGMQRLLLLQEALYIIALSDRVQPLSSIGWRQPLQDAEYQRIDAIYAYSLQHFRRAIQLEEIAGIAHISPNSFCRFFKSRTRKTYSRFLIEIRVGHACKLLIENNLPIKQVCYDSGFNNFTSFYKYFKLITGKSPLRYQRLRTLTRTLMILFAVLLSLRPSGLRAQGAAPRIPRVFVMNGDRLAELKERLQQKDPHALSLLGRLQEQAAPLLAMRPLSVMDKPAAPPSGDRHDYMSQAPYFWYDSSKPKGLPYLRRDGQRNPEIYTITDHKFLGDLDNAVRSLSLAWYLGGDKKYAWKAASLLRRWFLDDSTRMNPNLRYAQAVPGMNDGRGIGIIESISLMGIADAAGLLEGSPAWSLADAAALRQWYAAYLHWMLTSDNGKDEHAAKNNHGTWYLAQAVDFALITGETATAKSLCEEGKTAMENQIDGEGKMTLELERTNGLGYSTYNLQAWFRLAALAEKTGTDLWQIRNDKGAGIQTALDWLLPYAMGEKKWTYQQISPYNRSDLAPVVMQASLHYKNPRYAEIADLLSKGNAMSELLRIIY